MLKSVTTFKISVISDCSLKRIGDLPFEFSSGSCGTFNIGGVPKIFLCFYAGDCEQRTCKTLTRVNGNEMPLGEHEEFNFENEFIVENSTDSRYNHWMSAFGNYQGKLF